MRGYIEAVDTAMKIRWARAVLGNKMGAKKDENKSTGLLLYLPSMSRPTQIFQAGYTKIRIKSAIPSGMSSRATL